MSPLNLEVLQTDAKNRERRGSERYKLLQSVDKGINIKKFLTIKEEELAEKETPRQGDTDTLRDGGKEQGSNKDGSSMKLIDGPKTLKSEISASVDLTEEENTRSLR